jgi:hypothetical protein
MKVLSRIILALVTIGSCAVAGAQTSSQADQERRARNREEAIANHQRMQGNTSSSTASTRSGSTARENVRDATHAGANTVRSKTKSAAKSTSSFTHRQLSKVRNFGERQQRRLPQRASSTETNKSETAIGK